MEATIQKAKQNVRCYLELKGYEILEGVWCHDGGSVDFIATEFPYESNRTTFSRRPIPIVFPACCVVLVSMLTYRPLGSLLEGQSFWHSFSLSCIAEKH